MRALLYVDVPMQWTDLPNAFPTKHHFKLISENDVFCAACKKTLAGGEIGFLQNFRRCVEFKKESIRQKQGTYLIPDFYYVMCKTCFYDGVGHIKGTRDIHHRVVISYNNV